MVTTGQCLYDQFFSPDDTLGLVYPSMEPELGADPSTKGPILTVEVDVASWLIYSFLMQIPARNRRIFSSTSRFRYCYIQGIGLAMQSTRISGPKQKDVSLFQKTDRRSHGSPN